MRMYGINVHSVHNLIWLVVTLLVLFCSLFFNAYGEAYMYLFNNPFSTTVSPPVTLQIGTAGTSTIYTNNTSAKASVVALVEVESTYDYVLKVNNTFTDVWQIRLKKYSDSNINRLQNCTIYFHNSTDGTSNQICIENSAYAQDVGSWYNLPSSATIYITVTVEANSTGASYIYAYLEILIPNTTTYTQYIITFEIT